MAVDRSCSGCSLSPMRTGVYGLGTRAPRKETDISSPDRICTVQCAGEGAEERDLAVLLPAHTLPSRVPMLDPGHSVSASPRFTHHGRVPSGQGLPNGYDPASVHIASLAEKRRLWWTNALINAFFITAW